MSDNGAPPGSAPTFYPYDYSYFPVMGYSLYGNCYLVEQFAPYRPYLVRVCPPR